MKLFELLHVTVAQAFYKLAMWRLGPMHADVPKIMLRQHALAEKYQLMWA